MPNLRMNTCMKSTLAATLAILLAPAVAQAKTVHCRSVTGLDRGARGRRRSSDQLNATGRGAGSSASSAQLLLLCAKSFGLLRRAD
jgi:hypothetical protein